MKKILPYLLVLVVVFAFTTFSSQNKVDAKTTTTITKWKNGKIKTKKIVKTYDYDSKIKIDYRKYNNKGKINYNKITRKYTYSKNDYISTITYSNYITNNKKRNWKTKIYKKYYGTIVDKKIVTKRNNKAQITNQSTTKYYWKGTYDKIVLSDYKIINKKRAWGKRTYYSYDNSYISTKSTILRDTNGVNISTKIWEYDYDIKLFLNYLYSYQYILKNKNNKIYDNVKHYYNEYGDLIFSEINGEYIWYDEDDDNY